MHSPRRFALAGRLDEYGDIRSRPHRDTTSSEPHDVQNSQHGHGQPLSSPGADGQGSFRDQNVSGSVHDFDADMFQWPFIDGSWSAGFDGGLDGLWHHSGLLDSSSSMR